MKPTTTVRRCRIEIVYSKIPHRQPSWQNTNIQNKKHKIIIFYTIKTIADQKKGNDTRSIIFKQTYFTVPFRVPPRYNPRRRSGIGWGTTISSRGPPSPCPSEHPFSSASSSLSEGSSGHRSHEDDISIVTGIT